MHLVGGQPGSKLAPGFWPAVRDLYETSFPGLPAAIDRAASAGARWQDVTTPFVAFEDERCERAVAHVGLISNPMRLGGRAVQVAGIHAVCTHPDRRREGLARAALAAALEWADLGHPLAKLHTDLPEGSGPIWWTFPPDRFEPGAEPVPAPAEVGTFMTRGPWPAGLGPIGLSPLWEH